MWNDSEAENKNEDKEVYYSSFPINYGFVGKSFMSGNGFVIREDAAKHSWCNAYVDQFGNKQVNGLITIPIFADSQSEENSDGENDQLPFNLIMCDGECESKEEKFISENKFKVLDSRPAAVLQLRFYSSFPDSLFDSEEENERKVGEDDSVNHENLSHHCKSTLSSLANQISFSLNQQKKITNMLDKGNKAEKNEDVEQMGIAGDLKDYGMKIGPEEIRKFVCIFAFFFIASGIRGKRTPIYDLTASCFSFMFQYQWSDIELLEQIGSGQYGTVYKARTLDDKIVAVKILRQTMDITEVEMFCHECSLMAHISSVNSDSKTI